MDHIYTPAVRVLVAAVLLAATATLLHVTVRTAAASGASPIDSAPCGEAHHLCSFGETQGRGCRRVDAREENSQADKPMLLIVDRL
jgi:hypothetical protein